MWLIEGMTPERRETRMKTVYDVKQAINHDLYVNMVREIQAERREVKPRPRRKRNKWGELFPVCKSGK